MPENNAWYCCQCNNGPYSWSLYKSCIGCEHKCCSSCSSAYIKGANLASNTTNNRTISYEDDTSGSVNGMFSATDDGGNIHSRVGQSSTHFTLGSVPEGPTSLVLAPASLFDVPPEADPSIFPSENLIAPPELSASGPEDNPRDGEVYWVCHNCANGAWMLSTTPSCINCNHPRCTMCSSFEA